jgi:hypothetical protein
MEALTGDKTKGPRRGLSVKLKKAWPPVKGEVDEMEDLTKFEWKAPGGLPPV